MSEAVVGKSAPLFELPATSGDPVKLADLKGGQVVLYFYPRDNTPGCTTESQDFAKAHKRFEKAGTRVFGVSQDPINSHLKFSDKLKLPFDLLSDESGEVCRQYAVLKLKKMYGREFMGIERSTFLIDASGKLVKEWRKVKVPEHVKEVLAAVEAAGAAK